MNLKQTATDVANLLDNRRQHVMSRAQRRLWRLRRSVSERSLDARLKTVERLDEWTEPLHESSVLSGLATAVDKAAVLDTGVDDYDERTAKELVSMVKDLDDLRQLHRIARYESAHKDRVTVLRAVDRRLSQLEPEVVAWQPWTLSDHDGPVEATA